MEKKLLMPDHVLSQGYYAHAIQIKPCTLHVKIGRPRLHQDTSKTDSINFIVILWYLISPVELSYFCIYVSFMKASISILWHVQLIGSCVCLQLPSFLEVPF